MSNIKKSNCIKHININELFTIHPLLNYVLKFTDNPPQTELCHVLPQLRNNILTFVSKFEKDNNLNISLSNETKNEPEDEIDKCKIADPLSNFTIPVNSNNFIEVVFNINSISRLSEWIDNFDLNNKEVVKLVLNLFWVNYCDKIDDNYDEFVKFNQKIIKLIFNKSIDQEITIKIVNRLIRNNYCKKIKYLDKIKKYLMKYI